MTSPGKQLIDLAKYLELRLHECGRNVSCVDLAYGSSVVTPVLKGDCDLQVDVGPDQNPYRRINLNNGDILYQPQNGCVAGWRFNGVARVTAPYEMSPADCCHEHTQYTYTFTNTIAIVSQAIADWLDENVDGEGVQTEFVTSYNGGAVTVAINFSMRVCFPSCEDLLAEEAIMLGEIDEY